MGVVKKCGREIILLINGLFGIIGLFCFGGGLFVKFGSNELKSLMPTLMNEIANRLEPVFKATHTSSSEFLKKLDFEKLLGGAAVIFIVFGAILLFIVFWGVFGLCCKSKCALYIYSVIVFLILIGQITCAIIITKRRDLVDKNLKPELKESLQQYYMGDYSLDAVTILWNAIMLKFSCCGVDNYDDLSHGVWNRTPTAYITSNLDTPLMCCNEKERGSTTTNWWTCAKKPLVHQKSNYWKGCYNEVWTFLEKYVKIIVGCFGGLGALELLLIFLAIYIGRGMDNGNKVSDTERRKRK